MELFAPGTALTAAVPTAAVPTRAGQIEMQERTPP